MKFHLLTNSFMGQAIAKFKKEFFLVGLFSMVSNLLLLSPTIYMLQIYDRILVSKSLFSLSAVTLILIWFFLVIAISEWMRSRLLVRIGMEFDKKLSAVVFRSSFQASLLKPGYQVAEALADLSNVRQFITGNGVIALFDIPWTPFYVVIAFILHPLLGWMSIIFVAFQLIMAWINHRKTSSFIEVASKANHDESKYIHNKLRNSETVDAMGMRSNLMFHWDAIHSKNIEESSRSLNVQQKQQSLTKFCRYVMQSLTLGAAALLVIMGELTLGAMIAANVLVSRALQPIDIVVSTYKQFVQTKISFKRLDELFAENEKANVELIRDIPQGMIELANLTAWKPDLSSKILDDLNAKFSQGKVIAIIGPSGSGKSTLARCLVGVWPFFEGDILIGNAKVHDYDREVLGLHLGYLPQDVELIDGTVSENICRFGELDSGEVIEAAKTVGVHEMILRLPQGYDTQIGDAGAVLSGGYRQRIALARAVYGKPSYLILDEPNSNLDDIGERSLISTISHFKQLGKTVILISHKFNIFGIVDDLILMKNGQISMHGPREEVLGNMQKDESLKVAGA